MRFELPRLMLAAPASNTGKTTLTIALLQALKNRGMAPVAYKCGPDYIDPMFHREVLGVPGYNLDLFFSTPNTVLNLLAAKATTADIAIMEGVMGYYDGAGMTEEASSWHLASETVTPAVLVVRPGGASLSIAALVKGILEFRENSQIKGVVLNDCKPVMADRLATLIARECGIKVFGCLPDAADAKIGSRHLGLVAPEEVAGFKEKACLLAQLLEENADIEGLLALAGEAPSCNVQPHKLSPVADVDKGVRIGIAQDEAFCFYYRENLELLESLGATLVYFSPLHDTTLPTNISGLYFGGGYPELHAEALSANFAMRDAVARAIGQGLPTIAECGGFLYLQQQLEDAEGVSHPMVSALEGEGYNRQKLDRFGYVSLTACEDNLICKQGDTIKGHEFHYWDSTQAGSGFIAQKPHSKRQWPCVQASQYLYAGFPHLYFWSNLQCATRFVAASATYQESAHYSRAKEQ